MTFGLIGSHYWKHICTLKRELVDRGHKAFIILPTYFPQYYLATVSKATITLDHIELLDLDGFYVGLLETRERFFRGRFGKSIWLALRHRYLEFAKCEIENLSLQLSLLLMLGDMLPCVNSPYSLLLTRLRVASLRKLEANGIPVADLLITNDPAEDARVSKCVRVEEDNVLDVPCFPRCLESCLRLIQSGAAEIWKVMGIRHQKIRKMIVADGNLERQEPIPSQVSELVERILKTLDLQLAQVDFIKVDSEVRVGDVHPMPDWTSFEEATGEPISAQVAELLVQSGGAR